MSLFQCLTFFFFLTFSTQITTFRFTFPVSVSHSDHVTAYILLRLRVSLSEAASEIIASMPHLLSLHDTQPAVIVSELLSSFCIVTVSVVMLLVKR